MNNYMRGRLGGCLVLIVIAVVIGAGVAVYQGIVAAKHASFSGPFKPQMAAYLAPAQESSPSGQEEPKTPGTVKGKMVVLNHTTQDFDWDVTDELPADLKAVKPEEVGTVVLVDWNKVRKENYEYEGGSPAYYQACDVTVIDHASRTVIGKNHFLGGEPPSSIGEHDSEGVGSKPTQAVVDYLKGLPRG